MAVKFVKTNPYFFPRKISPHKRLPQNKGLNPLDLRPITKIPDQKNTKSSPRHSKITQKKCSLYKCPYLHRDLYKTPAITGEAPAAPKFHKTEEKEKKAKYIKTKFKDYILKASSESADQNTTLIF